MRCTDGWADPPDDRTATPAGERTRAYARLLVNGQLDGFDTELADGDRVAPVYPLVFCVQCRRGEAGSGDASA